RADSSSSAGSSPMRRTMWLAVLFRWVMKGRKAALNQRCALPTRLATASGEEIAQFFGTSSPTTIRNTVDRAVPITSASERDADSETPMLFSGPEISAAIDGSESMPTTRLVTVMPSCAPDSWNVRFRTALRAPAAPRSPRSTARSSSARSTVVRENSAATNAPQASESRTAPSSRSTSVIGTPPSHGRTGPGRMRDGAYREARPWADAHNLSWRTEWPSKSKGWAKGGSPACGSRAERLHPAPPPLLGPVPGGAPGTVGGGVVPQHHRVGATPAQGREPRRRRREQRRGDTLPAALRMHRQPVQVAAPAVEAGDH